ncbi:MAG: hypothetical protein GF317_02860 [Candidatus Lokiarchaeota archaeon]|nr:hypothetical protein [Candidatus Lokiarchaeota archaeon]MBD3198847.1 hypothetical protein [Candidatus Lokiarchaeota archaeon]
MNFAIVSWILWIYLGIYVLFHIPIDILMLIRRKEAEYPNPDFKNNIQAVLFILPSFIFWLYLLGAPILFFYYGISFYGHLIYLLFHSFLSWFLQICGLLIMSFGLIISCLGRIGRGLYLAKNKEEISMKWGHRIVRHPEYLFYITGFLGLPLLTLNPILLILISGIIGYISFTDTEEKALINHFGKEYKSYMKKVGKLFPKIKE